MNPDTESASRDAAFLTTRWTRVSQAKSDSEEGRRALSDLCEAYYDPVVAYLRQVQPDREVAREMAHAFFADLLGTAGRIASADRGRGRFRSYLLGAVKHFVFNHHQAASRMKRGGGSELIPLDAPGSIDIADGSQLSPDAAFDQQWARTVISRSLDALKVECRMEGKETLFEAASFVLNGQAERGDQTRLAATCGMSFDAFRMAVSRLRKRLRECVKAEVAVTLDEAADIQEEMRALFAALGS